MIAEPPFSEAISRLIKVGFKLTTYCLIEINHYGPVPHFFHRNCDIFKNKTKEKRIQIPLVLIFSNG